MKVYGTNILLSLDRRFATIFIVLGAFYANQIFMYFCIKSSFGTQVKLADCKSALKKKGKRKVQGVPQSQTAALPRPQEEEVTDKSK